LFWHARAEAGDATEPSHLRRGERIALDTAERPVAGERAAPAEQAPDMDGGVSQIFQPLWIATRPPSIGSTETRAKPARSIIALNFSMSGKRRIDSMR